MPPRHTAPPHHSPTSSPLYPHHSSTLTTIHTSLHPATQPSLHTAPPHHSSTLTTLHTAPQHSPSTQPTSPPRPAEFIACFSVRCSRTFHVRHPLHAPPSPPSPLSTLRSPPSPLIPHPKQKKVSTSQSGPFRINNIIYFMVKSICQRHPRHIACLHHMPANATPRPSKPCRQ